MSPTWRAIYGGACGALVVLLCHPASRPFLLTPLTHWGESKTFKTSTLLLENQPIVSNQRILVVPRPGERALIDASLWMETGARELSNQESTRRAVTSAASYVGRTNLATKRDYQKLVNIAQWAAARDPDNAYWTQMEAVFLNAEAHLPTVVTATEGTRLRQQAVSAWFRAGSLTRWNDQQSKRLHLLQERVLAEMRSAQAWEYAAVYPLRSTLQAFFIDKFATEVLSSADFKKPGLALRYATLLNGKLLRDGAKSLEIQRIGIDIVERTWYDKSTHLSAANPRDLNFGQGAFSRAFNKIGDPEKANDVKREFENDAALIALTDPATLDYQSGELCFFSLLTASVPGALLGVGLLGAVLWLASVILRLQPALLKVVEAPVSPALGIVLATLLYYATGLALPSIAVVACFSFLAFTPPHERTQPPEELGGVFEITILVLSILLGIFGVAFIVGVSTPGEQILPYTNVPSEFYGGSTLFIGLCSIVMGLLLLAAPGWAMSQRLPTPRVVMLTFRHFGRRLFLGTLTLVIFVTPLAVVIDKALNAQLEEIVLNEPLHYLSH